MLDASRSWARPPLPLSVALRISAGKHPDGPNTCLHSEERAARRSNPATQTAQATQDCFASLAMTNLRHGRMAMNKHAGSLRNDSRAWVEVPADDNGDAMIA